MRHLALYLVALVLLQLVTAACADPKVGPTALRAPTARWAGLGLTGLVACDDAGAIDLNPAALATAQLERDRGVDLSAPDTKRWKTQCANSAELSGDVGYWGLTRAIRNEEKDWGIGLGFQHTNGPRADGDWWSIGLGKSIGESGWSVGASVQGIEPSLFSARGETIWTVGVVGDMRDWGAMPIKLGASVIDITNDSGFGPLLNVGVAVEVARPAAGGLVVAELDLWDLSDKLDRAINLGVEWDKLDGWSFRGGLINGRQPTLGIGYEKSAFAVDGSWIRGRDGTAIVSDQFMATVSVKIEL